MPKVSVIMPVYNVASYLDAAFISLQQQTLTDYEVIVVNDGSTDDSQDIISRYAQSDTRIISFQQHNQGQSVARNLALEHATGDYIYFMDSDDVIAPETLQNCYDYAEKTQADFVFFDGEIFYEDGAQHLPWNYKRSYLCEEYKAYDGEGLLNRMLDEVKHSCVVWLLFIRKRYLDDIKLSFYPGIIHEDELFTTLLTLQSKKIFCLKQALVNHRVRQTSTMGKRYSKRNINCYLTVFDELFKFQNTPLIRKFARYTLGRVFYTGHIISITEKPSVFWRALISGYLPFIGWKNVMVFWLKRNGA